MAPQIQWGHAFDLIRSRDIKNHVTIRLPGAEFLSVAHTDYAFICQSYGDMAPQR